MKYECPSCKLTIIAEYPDVIHAGFSGCGFMYCDECGDLLTWSTYDVGYNAAIPENQPWDLTSDEKRRVEKAVIGCACGGTFRFDAKPRCPGCNAEIPGIIPDSIHWVRLKRRIDGEKVNIWKTQ